MNGFASVCVFVAFALTVIGALTVGVNVLSAVLDDKGKTIHVLLALAFPLICALAVGLFHALGTLTGVK